MDKMNITVIKTDTGVYSLEEIYEIVKYITSKEFFDSFQNELRVNNPGTDFTYDNKNGYVQFGPRDIQFLLHDEFFNLYFGIAELWMFHNEKWDCDLAPVMNEYLGTEDWYETEKEFINKWNTWIDNRGMDDSFLIGNHGEGTSNMGYGYFQISFKMFMECMKYWEDMKNDKEED